MKNLLNLLIFRLNQKRKKYISFLIIIILILNILIYIPKNLKIYFIDVGQGDSTLIITPFNKKILIDGGGADFGDFDVGEKVLIPYLLNRRAKKIDYIVVSHMDSDHVRSDFYQLWKNWKLDK